MEPNSLVIDLNKVSECTGGKDLEELALTHRGPRRGSAGAMLYDQLGSRGAHARAALSIPPRRDLRGVYGCQPLLWMKTV